MTNCIIQALDTVIEMSISKYSTTLVWSARVTSYVR